MRKKSRNPAMKQKFPSVKFPTGKQNPSLEKTIFVPPTITSKNKLKLESPIKQSNKLDLEARTTKRNKQLNPSLIHFP